MLSILISFLALVAVDAIRSVNAGVFIVDPRQGSTCHGGEPCTVTWLDDGQNPLLPTVGAVTVGLFTGKQRLVQTIKPVNVAKVHSLTFTPIPAAGPNSDTYYISFISTSHNQNNSLPYAAFSPFFKLDKMTGSFDTPNPSATSSITIPSSITGAENPVETGAVLSTITVGTLSTSSTPKSTSTTSHTRTASASTITNLSSTPTSPIKATPSLSGFSTLTVPPSLGLLSSSVGPSVSLSSSSPALPSQNGNTNGARGSLSKTTGFTAVLAVLGILVAL